MKKTILLILVFLFVCLQFIRPTRNLAGAVKEKTIGSIHPVSPQVDRILKVACNDCHSNTTIYPWYANIQPVGLWLQKHVDEGKSELNFDEFATYSSRRQYNMMKGIIHQVKSGKMPLSSYVSMHKDADLSIAEKQIILEWAQGILQKLELH